MADAVAAITAPDRLLELAGRLERQEGFAEVVASLKAGHAATFDGVWGSTCALVAATLAAHAPGPLVVVCPRADDVDDLVDDLGLFLPGLTPEQFPACESLDRRAAAPRRGGRRPAAAAEIAASRRSGPRLVATSIQALLQPVPDREALARQTRHAARGPAAFAGGAGPLAGRETLSRHHRRGVAGRILAPRRHRRYLRPRLVRAGADRVLRRRDRIDPPLRGLQPAEPGQPRRRGSDGAGAALGRAADISPISCRRKAGFCWSSRASWTTEGRHYLERLERPQELHAVADVLRQVSAFPR